MIDAATPRFAITAGDPAGIGPDICLQLALEEWPAALAIIGDPEVIGARARTLGIDVDVVIVDHVRDATAHRPGHLQVVASKVAVPVVAGRPDPANADMVLQTLDLAVAAAMGGDCDAIVTAPVSKATLTTTARPFSGHTEYLAQAAGGVHAVMMLAAGNFRVALATTHLPLSAVPRAITATTLTTVIEILHNDLQKRFGIAKPKILVCGLNPHAGESGELGREEIEVITPVIKRLQQQGLRLVGPLPADTLFLPRNLATADAVLAMYHDQG
ncbi:MAG: 4-hydroxythreonine-4-phosphate dehydrogenase PdxA, partial [Gammaproteobacteria bacterium]|nr:4-hydroxythreonine-4-phosphate dehydrogenase PdxA [Gammaproteobacteria bacterium]